MNVPSRPGILLFLIVAMAGPATALRAQDFDLGARIDVMVGDGKPSNDVPSFSIFGRRHLNDRWSAELSLVHSPKFDVEGTPEYLGIVTPDVVDSIGTMTTVLLLAERRFGAPARRTEWFWGVGGGVAFVDVDPIEGTSSSGAPFAIETDAGTEPVLAAIGGLRFRLRGRFGLELALRAEEHFGEWTFRELTSGTEASESSYLLTGLLLGGSYRF